MSDLISYREVSKITGLRRKYFEKLVYRGKIAAVKTEDYPYIRLYREQIENYLGYPVISDLEIFWKCIKKINWSSDFNTKRCFNYILVNFSPNDCLGLWQLYLELKMNLAQSFQNGSRQYALLLASHIIGCGQDVYNSYCESPETLPSKIHNFEEIWPSPFDYEKNINYFQSICYQQIKALENIETNIYRNFILRLLQTFLLEGIENIVENLMWEDIDTALLFIQKEYPELDYALTNFFEDIKKFDFKVQICQK